jgi:hypothetical protein
VIPKGNQRGGGQQLATHLLNSYDNEKIEIAGVRGAVAQDLHGAFAEWHAHAKATQCRKYLYSLSVNPDHRQGPFKREQYYDFIRRVEKKLGLENQPRALVFHTKQGREHCHVVWSRIDTDKVKAVQLSHDRQSLRTVAQEFAKDHGITLPAGMQNDRGKKRFEDKEKRDELKDKQQQERTGITKAQHREAITALWKENGTGESFVRALEASGYYLARGDKEKPTYVVVDWLGEVHSLVRSIEGAKVKEVRARLVEYPIERLPSVAETKEFAQNLREQKLKQAASAPPKQPEPARDLETRKAELLQRQKARREELSEKRSKLERQHTAERRALGELQDAENKGVLGARATKQPKGILGFLARITGIQILVSMQQKKQDQQRTGEHVRQKQALQRRHEREWQDFSRHDKSLTRVEKRENRSYRTAVRRAQFRAISAPAMKPAPQLTPDQQAKVRRARELAEKFNRAGSAPQKLALTAEQRGAIETYKRDRRGGVTPAFNQAATEKSKGAPPPSAPDKPPAETKSVSWHDTLTAAFTKSASGVEQTKSSGDKEVTNGHAGSSDSGGGGLTKAFNKAQQEEQHKIEEERARKTRNRDRDRGR